MVGLRINPKNQRQFNYLKTLTLALSIVLDESGLEAVRTCFNAVFDEYYILSLPDNNIDQKNKNNIFDLMEKYILKGDLPQTLAEWWYYFLVRDCITYGNNFDTYHESFERKLDKNLQKLEYMLASDMRNMVREEVKALAPNAYWVTSSSDPCQECKDRDGLKLTAIPNLSIHPNCKCFILIK